MTRIGIILGSTRPNRNGEQVAKWVYETAALRSDADFELVDLRDYPLPHLDEPLPPLIHFYWVKGDMTPAAVSNLCAWAQRTQDTAWQVYLWTESAITPCCQCCASWAGCTAMSTSRLGSLTSPSWNRF